jgi:hypothetical protein
VQWLVRWTLGGTASHRELALKSTPTKKMAALVIPHLSQKEIDKLVTKAAKQGVGKMLDLMDKWLSDRSLVTLALTRLLSSPLDPVSG